MGGGGKSLLKSHYKKSLFTLIKSAKRFYFGSWIVKLPFYAIFNESKAQKYREKRTIRYENLQITKRQFKRIRTLAPQIKAWVESDEFKEKYANHPYPPLLNPQNIDYESIPADLAWDLNLPLPDNYSFIFLTTHGVGRAATGSYLSTCGVPYFDELSSFDSNKYRYMANYDILNSYKYPYNIITFAELKPEQEKFIYLLKKKPFLILIRDPISQLKSLFNYPSPKWELRKDYTLQDRDFLVYGRYSHKPAFNEDIMLTMIPHIFQSFSNKVPYHRIIDNAVVIQTDDVKTQNAFNTFIKLSHIFGFESPKEQDRQIFETNFVQGMLSNFLPIVLKIKQNDLSDGVLLNAESFTIQVLYGVNWNLASYTLHKKGDFIDITDFLDLKQQAINNLCVKIEKQYFYILQKDSLLVRKIKKYLEDLLFAIYEQNELYKKQAICTEQDILTFLRYATNCRKKFKAHLDERVGYFKENHADIVASWKYYKEFEAMCAELDST